MELLPEPGIIERMLQGVNPVRHEQRRPLVPLGEEVAHRPIQGSRHAHRDAVDGNQRKGAVNGPDLLRVAVQHAAAGEDRSMITFEKTDKSIGVGAEAVAGRRVTVHYTGWLYDANAADHHGRKFDSSRDRGEPFAFMLGARQVIAGWDQGVAGMRVGGSRTLTIPPDLGYGARGAGGVIPPNAVLVFEIELLGVR